jgi:hypothetical protein
MQERKSLVDVATGDSVLAPLLAGRPGIEAKLYEMLDDKPDKPGLTDEGLELLVKHFDRQDRTVAHFQSNGWDVAWLDGPAFDLAASKDSDRLLVRVARGDESNDDDTVQSLLGAITMFQNTHPNADSVKSAIVIASDVNYPNLIDEATQHGVTVLGEKDDGLEYLVGP